MDKKVEAFKAEAVAVRSNQQWRRKQIIADLLKFPKWFPDKAQKAHKKIADAISKGANWNQLVEMKEVNDYPDTYFWLKTEFRLLEE